MVHVAPHFSLCAPAYGRVGATIARGLAEALPDDEVVLLRTQMALGGEPASARQRELQAAAGIDRLETNDDLRALLDHLAEQSDTRCIVLACAVCDFEPEVVEQSGATVSALGKDGARLKTDDGALTLTLRPSDKLVRRVRRTRKDIFLVAFKATAGATEREAYRAGLTLLKRASANLVFANDVRAHHNMIVTPEEFPYHAPSRDEALRTLVEMIRDRTALTFVRTEVHGDERADPVALSEAGAIPPCFVPVLSHLIARGAYKPFLGKTSGHFGCLVLDPSLPFVRIASIRKVGHNRALEDGMARILGTEGGRIVASGAKPSVGEHTQQRIYERFAGEVHAIVHFHSPLRAGVTDVPVAPQRPFECGSVQCGENTADHMVEVSPGIFAVHLDGHGPNIAFHRDVAAERVIAFIEERFDLDDKTGGRLDLEDAIGA